jgi:hypothetical protein
MKFSAPMAAVLLALSGTGFPGLARASEPALEGTKDIVLHTRDGKDILIGSVTFTPKDGETAYAITFDDKKFAEYFLSMREFKCVEGDDILCHVPYPYASPHTVTRQDLGWLEHALLFIFKKPTEYGARMANGLIYSLKITDKGLVGTPKSIDLDEIAVPPDDLTAAYYNADRRYDLQPGARWVESLTIENHR